MCCFRSINCIRCALSSIILHYYLALLLGVLCFPLLHVLPACCGLDPVNLPAYVYGDKNATQIVTLNTPVVVRCPAGGYPAPMVYWWRNRERLPLVHRRYEFMRDYSIRFHSIQLTDLGPYTCHVWNRVSTRPASIKIILKAIGPVRAVTNEEASYLQYIVDPAQAPRTERPPYPYRPTRPPAVPAPIYEGAYTATGKYSRWRTWPCLADGRMDQLIPIKSMFVACMYCCSKIY